MPGLRFIVLPAVRASYALCYAGGIFPQERILPFAEGAPRGRALKHGHGSRRILVRRRKGCTLGRGRATIQAESGIGEFVLSAAIQMDETV